MNLKPLIRCFILCLIANTCYAVHFNFIHYNTNNSALPHDICYHLLQDRQGYIWIATDDGLVRFDGRDMKLYQRGFRSRFVIALASTDSLFLASTWKGSIHRIQGDTITSFPIERGREWLPKYCNSILLYKDIVLLFRFGEVGAYRYDSRGNSLKQITLYSSNASGQPVPLSMQTDFRFCAAGDRLIACNNSGIYVLQGLVFRQVSQLKFQYIMQGAGGRLFGYHDNAIYSIDPGLNSCILYRQLPAGISLQQSFLDRFYVLPSGNIILSMKDYPKRASFSAKGKYLFIDIHSNTVSDLARALHINLLVGDILPGRNDDFWISTDGDGVYHVFEPKYDHYGNNNEFRTPYITALAKGNEGQLYIGTKNGIYALANGRITARYNNYVVYSFFRNSNGAVLARSRYSIDNIKLGKNEAVKDHVEYDRRETAHYVLESTYTDSSIPHRIRDKRSGRILPDSTNIQQIFPFNDICEDAKGRLWIAADPGLYTWDEHLQQMLLFPHAAVAAFSVNKLIADSTGGLWVAGKQGLFYIRDYNVKAHYEESNGLINTCVNTMLLYRNHLWIGTLSGLNILDIPSGELLTCKKNDGLQANDITAMCFYTADTIALGSSKGITLINAAKPGFAIQKTELIMEQVHIADVPVPFSTGIRAAYRQQIGFKYTVISCSYPELTKFRYRLSGDAPWIETQNRSLVFSNLEPGNYRLELQARVYNSNWSKPVTCALVIKDPWWATPLCYAIVLTLALLAILYIVRTRERSYRQRISLKQQFSELKLKALQTQLNPHFISNTLNAIQLLSLKNDEIATSDALTGFAQLTRMLLESSHSRFITLKDELQILDLYLKLEQLRFGNAFTYSIEVDKNIDTAKELVPGVLLQPFAENSINHGIANLPGSVTGLISITVQQQEGLLVITLSDNGIGRHKAKDMQQQGNKTHLSRSTAIIEGIVQAVNTLPGCYLQVATSDIGVNNNSSSGTRVQVRCCIRPSYTTTYENSNIEDELPAIESLRLLLHKYCPDIEIAAVARSFREAYDTCREHQPDLVFCDIQLPADEGTGLDLVQLLSDKHMKVIFTSGWKDFAVDAFRVNAVDYLLKPLNITELISAVEKARQKSPVAIPAGNGHLHIPTHHGFLLMPFRDIIRCQAEGPYTHFYCSGKEGKRTSSVTLGSIGLKLPETHFFRVHKTHMINRAHIIEYIRTEGSATVRMTDNMEVPVSRLAREAFIKWLG